MKTSQVNRICSQVISLSRQQKDSQAQQLWQTMKVYPTLYHFVEPDFQFKKALIINRDVKLVQPALLKLSKHEPLKFRGIMNHFKH